MGEEGVWNCHKW